MTHVTRPRRALVPMVVCLTLAVSLVGCWGQKAKSPTEPVGVRTLKSYRWTTDLRAESSLFDQSQAPEALRGAPVVIRAHAEGDRVTPDRERVVTTVSPVATEPRETITIGDQRWNRLGSAPWRQGGEAFPATRAYFGGSVDLSAKAILEPAESSAVVGLRQQLGEMPYREEAISTGPARRYTLLPEQVAAVIADPQINPFAVLRRVAVVRIDLWIDQSRNVLVALRVSGDTATQAEAFLLELHVTEMDPAGLTIEAPR
ncbi:MAG: hypothetical protein DWI58_05420 [Chloroflexi bacterium]|nr:MAG: hypothetical protein DWI58_05420 [Chloroflexota bacterium]